MRNKMPCCCAAALGVAAMVVLSGLAPENKFLFTDNFNNNVIGPVWDDVSVGNGVHVTEVNDRLQFSATGNTGVLSAAGLEIAPWGINIKRDFQIEINSTLNLTNVNGGKQVFLGLGLANEGDLAVWPNAGDVIGVGILQDQFGMQIGWITLSNGAVVDFDGVPITLTNGKIHIEFDKSNDELTIERNGETVTYEGFFTDFGAAHPDSPLVITIGCVTLHGATSFSGSRVRLDNFEFNGFKRGR